MSTLRKFLQSKALLCIAMALLFSAIFLVLNCAQAADPRIAYIIRTNITRVEVHFGTEVNRSYTLQGMLALRCTNGHCNASGVDTNAWVNLLGPLPKSPVTNHIIYSERITNQSHFFRLLVSP